MCIRDRFLGPLFVHSFSLDCLWHAYKPTAWQTNSGGGFGDVRYINIKKINFFWKCRKSKKFHLKISYGNFDFFNILEIFSFFFSMPNCHPDIVSQAVAFCACYKHSIVGPSESRAPTNHEKIIISDIIDLLASCTERVITGLNASKLTD